MSDQGLFIKLVFPDNGSQIGALRSLLSSGWRPDDHGTLRYLIVGDDGDFDWNATPIANVSSVIDELQATAKDGQTIGIVLTFTDTMIGGEWLFFPNGDVAFSPSINRKMVNSYSDVGWYLYRVLPALEGIAAVESWRWEEMP